MDKIIVSFLLVFCLHPASSYSQIFYSNGATIHLNAGAIVLSNGGFQLSNSTSLTNEGDLKITKNSTLLFPGDMSILTGSVVNGNGKYQVEQNWINNATFNAENSEVSLYGNTEQQITSTNGTITEFNILTLSGTGVGVDRRKSLINVDARTSATGLLQLNDRELATGSNTFYVLNPAISSVQNSTTFGSEGFVSSLDPGYLNRETNSQNEYIFPVGSSNGTLRYRPVGISPALSANQSHSVRLNNYLADTDGYPLAQHESIIDLANSNFYHSIERTSGAANADINIYYLPSDDGNWTNMAHWYSSDVLWKTTGQNTQGGLGNYTSVEKADWNFPTNSFPYVLTTIADLVIVPTAFTPNGDDVNEEWEIPNLDLQYPNNVVRIYNRWGNLLFEHNSEEDGAYSDNQWDGKYNSENMPVGSYYFIIDLNDVEKKTMNGIVSIIKE